ncbi:HIT family protein [Candidatus Nomurabacteria bacterium]|nr:HIT family protein [Candidatus Nomurabacteria bacterium]
MEECIFCKIIKGQIPSTKIYEDDKTLAFLDIAPVNIGHALIIPKEHYANIYETPEDTMSDIIKVAKKISLAVKEAVKAEGVNITMNNNHAAGQVIFHSHIHVIPRFSNDGFELWHGKRAYEDDEMKSVAENITSKL